MPNDDVVDHVKAGRTSKEDARAGDPVAPREGIQPAPLSFAEKAGVVDLGVNEPVLPEGAEEPESGPGSDPTGMYAGETTADRAGEDAVRETLEERFPTTRGDWKSSGAMPPGKDRETP